MKITTLMMFAVVGSYSGFAVAQEKAVVPEFAVVDKDKDGVLSISEAQLLFPSLEIEDVVTDGLLSKKEAERAMPGLVYSDDNHEDDTKLVGADEYILMAEQYLVAAQDATAK